MHNTKDIFNLKLTDISGNTSEEILDTYINNLENFINTTNLPSSSYKIYMAYLNGLKYYQSLANPNDNAFKELLSFMNSQYITLKKKYPKLNLEGRIKSLLSADEKIKDKICEYIKENRDLKNLNFSLRDFIAFRYILPKNKFFNSEFLEVQRCYKLLKDQIHIAEKQGFNPIPIRKERLEKIKGKHNYNINPKEVNLYIPKFKSPFFLKRFSSFVRDYIRYPKETLYQSLHYSANLPNFENTSQKAIEFQFRTSNMHKHSEYGIFSHDKIYKQNNFFHILNVPTYIKSNNYGLLEPLTFEKNLKTKYDDFQNIYNIPYSAFKSKLSLEEQKKLLDGTHCAVFNNSSYKWEIKELKFMPILDYKKYQINHTSIQKNFRKIIKHSQKLEKESER